MSDQIDLQQAVEDPREIEAVEGFMVDVQVYLHELLERKGVSRAELARRMGISRARVTHMFSHASNLTIRQLARAAYHLEEEPRVESETTRTLRGEREGARREAALGASPNVVRLWKDVSPSNPVDVPCSGEDRRIDGIVLLARRTGTR